jgi:hypothetical protein
MPEHAGTFTVGVFPDAERARLGIDALRRHHFAVDSLSIVARASEAVSAFGADIGRPSLATLDLPRLGASSAGGPLVTALQGEDGGLTAHGLAPAMRRIGFQPHDGIIFERLVEKGGILVAVHHEPRAAEALSVLHNYGAGNAAIGAWQGRL